MSNTTITAPVSADLRHDFIFKLEDGTAYDLSAKTASVVLTPPRGGTAVTLTLGSGLVSPAATNRVAVRVESSTMASWAQGLWSGYVKVVEGADDDILHTFFVDVCAFGLPVHGETTVYEGESIVTLGSRGPAGLSAKQIVIDAGDLPANATDEDFAEWLREDATEAAAAATAAAAAANAAASAATTATTNANAATAGALSATTTAVEAAQDAAGAADDAAAATVAALAVTAAAQAVVDAAATVVADAEDAAETAAEGVVAGLLEGLLDQASVLGQGTVTVTDGYRVLVAGDDEKLIIADRATPIDIWAESDLAADFDVEVVKLGAGDVRFRAGDGAVIRAAGGFDTLGLQYGFARLRAVGAGVFVVQYGDEAAPAPIGRALFDRPGASGHALSFFA